MKYFTLSELIKSNTAIKNKIDNTPDETQKQNLIALVENILDPLREAYGKPIIVTSGFRCTKLNKLVGGVSTSQHQTGEAADIRTKEDTVAANKELFQLIQKLDLPFDQLINEHNFDWVHVSYSDRNRKQVLKV